MSDTDETTAAAAGPEPAADTTTGAPAHDGADEDAATATDPADTAVADDASPASDERYLRLAADFENHRRRTQRELADRARYAPESAARALLPVLDNLHRAVDAAPAGTPEGLLAGLRQTVRQFEEALASVGVVPIDAAGQPFDPSRHEAVMAEESDEVEVETVVQDLQRGYVLHDRVLRPSMVKVAHPAHAPHGAA